jgi:hypothetical protein
LGKSNPLRTARRNLNRWDKKDQHGKSGMQDTHVKRNIRDDKGYKLIGPKNWSSQDRNQYSLSEMYFLWRDCEFLPYNWCMMYYQEFR